MPKITEEYVSHLFDEINLCEKLIDTELRPKMDEAMKRYIGEYIPQNADDWDVLINEIYANVQLNLPSTFFQTPRVYCRAKNKNYIAKELDPVTGRKIPVLKDSQKSSVTQEAVMNYLIQENNYKDEVRKVNLDAHLFPYGASWKGYYGDFGIGDDGTIDLGKEELFYRRWRPDWILWDPAATDLQTCRWIGRKIELPIEDVLHDKRFKIDKELKGKLGFQNKLSPQEQARSSSTIQTLSSYASEDYRKSSRSHFIELIELWIRPGRDEEGYGTVVTLTKEKRTPLNEKPWPYDMEGWPLNILAYSPLNDQLIGLNEVLIYSDQVDEKNAIRNAQLQNAKSNANVTTVVDGNAVNEEQQRKFLSGDNKLIVSSPPGGDIRSTVMFNTPGNVSGEFYLLDQKNQDDLDRISGIPDLRRGIKTPGEETKFSVQQRVMGVQARPAYKVDLMKDFILRDMKQFNQLEKQYFTIQEVIKITGDLDSEWVEGYTKEDIQADVDIDIDIYSMLPPNPEQEIEFMLRTLNLATTALSNSKIENKILQEGNVFNLSPIIKQLLRRLNIHDPEVFRKIRPEESMGFVSIFEMKAAESNITSLLQGQPFPSPPAEGQDHKARIEVYGSVLRILMTTNPNPQLIQMIQQLIQAQMAIQAEEDKKKNQRSGQQLRQAEQAESALFAGIA